MGWAGCTVFDDQTQAAGVHSEADSPPKYLVTGLSGGKARPCSPRKSLRLPPLCPPIEEQWDDTAVWPAWVLALEVSLRCPPAWPGRGTRTAYTWGGT